MTQRGHTSDEPVGPADLPGAPTREQLLAEGRKQARIHGMDPATAFAEIYAEGWVAAAQRSRVEVSNANYWRDTARQERDLAQRDLAGAKERIKIRDETIRDLQERISEVREAIHVADDDDHTDWQRGYRALADRVAAVLDGQDEEKP